jgi:hypothetical protein
MTAATRTRLRLVAPFGATTAVYGGGTYGAGSYGQEQDETATAIEYTAVPVPAGTVDGPAWQYTVGDTYEPLIVDLIAVDGTDRLTSDEVEHAVLVATRFTDGYTRSLLLEPDGNYWRRDFDPDDLDQPGLYRNVVVCTLTSGRRYTIPADDRLTMKVTAP